tara:strand:- start:101 stop:349 length:249 start_codon:yes stop_codon:yes gene_type:complete
MMSKKAAIAQAEIQKDRLSKGLPPIKPPLLEAASLQIARMRDAAERVEEEGLLIADVKGNPIPHPALEIERLAAEQLRRLLA